MLAIRLEGCWYKNRGIDFLILVSKDFMELCLSKETLENIQNLCSQKANYLLLQFFLII